MPETRTTDVLIAGQGAAAFAAALYTARYQIHGMIVGDRFGGETAIGGGIENYPGYPEIDGFDLMLKFREQVDKYEVPIVDAALTGVENKGDHFVSTLSDGTTVESGAVIFAIGRERRKLNLEHEEAWTGKGVSYCSTCDAPLYREKTAAVVGGGSAAVEGAILLGKYTTETYLIYRGDKFRRPEPVLVDLLEKSENVHVLFETEVTELVGDDTKGLTGIKLSKSYEGQDELTLDGVFIEIGADPRIEIPQSLGVELNHETNEIHVDRNMNTNVAGIFGAGDITDGSGSLKQTITAAAQGAISALAAYQYISEHGHRCDMHEKGFDLKADAAD
ncbi:MAG: FAD-dependent oxidoreductase [Chloroflexi bacterium]|jgi:thioredoxin reductase (NADPH)|nr:FAD-dependent oxidoreductase [Chloroflexota bacterium]MBT6681490.1 FAD-dependent oxidoreductase [Chloroflexota bacterium]